MNKAVKLRKADDPPPPVVEVKVVDAHVVLVLVLELELAVEAELDDEEDVEEEDDDAALDEEEEELCEELLELPELLELDALEDVKIELDWLEEPLGFCPAIATK